MTNCPSAGATPSDQARLVQSIGSGVADGLAVGMADDVADGVAAVGLTGGEIVGVGLAAGLPTQPAENATTRATASASLGCRSRSSR
jgi:hypothetical protein